MSEYVLCMKPVVSEELVSEESVKDSNVEGVEAYIDKDSIKERALSELYDEQIIDQEMSYKTWKIENNTTSGETLALSRFVIIDDICYFSWIWVTKFLRGHGIGSRLLVQSLEEIQKRGAKEVYVLTKSDEAISMFESKGFKPVESPSGFHHMSF